MKPTTLIRAVDKLLVAPVVGLGSLARRLAVRILYRGRHPAPASGGARWVAVNLVGMGDAVLLLPALAALRRPPSDRLTVITTVRCRQVFAAPGVADAVIVLGGPAGWRELRAAWRALRECTRLLDFEQHVFWSAALTLATPLRSRTYGFRNVSRLRPLAYGTVVEPGHEPRHMKEIFDDLARAAGREPATGLLPLPVGAAAAGAVDAWLRQQGWTTGGYLAVAPGSGATVGFRRLPADAWGEVLGGLAPELPVVLVGTSVDRELLLGIQRATPRPVTVQLNLDLQRLAHLFARAWKVVATDSGPMHLAAAMGVPVVGVFGPDTPRRYAPYNTRSASVTLALPCSPCNNCWIYREARCTNPDRYACIRNLPAAKVLAAITGKTTPPAS